MRYPPPKEEVGVQPSLTLDEPSSPYAVVQTNLVPPQQPKTFEGLPFWRNNLSTETNKNRQLHNKYLGDYKMGQGSRFILYKISAKMVSVDQDRG